MKSLPKQHNTAVLLTAGLASAFLFGAATPASKALLDGIQVQSLAGLLYLGAALGVLPAVIRERPFLRPWRAGRPTVLLLTGAVVLGGVLGPLLLLLGLRLASAGSVSLWLNLEFVATVMLGHLVFKEPLTLRGWIAAGGTLVAAALLTGSQSSAGLLPVILIGAGCLCWGFDNHFTALIDGISPAQTTLWKGLVAGGFNLIMGGALIGDPGPWALVAAALLVGAVSYGISITLYVISAQGLGATRSQMVFSTAPFFGLLLSVTLLGEPFTGTQAIAAGLIAASLLILFSERHAHVHRHDPISHHHLHRHDDDHHDHHHNGAEATENHSHWHKHASPREHAHKHWPDLHHRHDHDDNQS